jgi:glycosyltransferase involved in cell wall biosynthesis
MRGVAASAPSEDVLISNGFNKFHLAAGAAEVDRQHRLVCLITGAYPTPTVRSALTLSRMSRSPKIARLLARDQPRLGERRVRPLWFSEAVNASATYGRRLPGLEPIAARIDRLSTKLYARQAVRAVSVARGSARIYHYRSGFGHRSARIARESGMILLCDHSISHPAVVDYLIDHDGALPASNARIEPSPRLADILEDIGQADAVLVNSHFVKTTFVQQGWDASKIHVIYLGVEDNFLDAVPPRAAHSGHIRLLFAGAVGRRKGAHFLLTALSSLDDVDWQLDLVGSIEPGVREAHGALLQDPRVRCLGTQSHLDVARLMADADVFVFPTLAEGSARVVFEALAAGCYVITTPNAGSIVEDGTHGQLIPPGDAESVVGAIRRAAEDRARLTEIGRSNEQLVRSSYRQEDYGRALVALYDSLLLTESRSAA